MPLFVTVTPGTTVSASTTLDAATLNLLGTPSVDVTGTVDGGSVTLGPQSVALPNLMYQVDQTIVGNGAGTAQSPVALTTTDFILAPTTVNIKALAVTTAKIANSNVTYAKIQDVVDARLLGRSAGSTGVVQELTVGSNLTLSAGALNALRPAVAFTTVLVPSSYQVTVNRVAPETITPLTTSITTQTATSKVLVTFNISYSISAYFGDSGKYAFILTRTIPSGETELSIPTSPLPSQVYGIKPVGIFSYNNIQVSDCIQFLDSPGPAASVTYKLKIYGSTAIPLAAQTGFFLNRDINDADAVNHNRFTSQVILQEILP